MAMNENSMPPEPRSRGRLVALLVGFIALVAIVVWSMPGSTLPGPVTGVSAPPELAGLPLDEAISGPAAVAELSALHGVELNAEDGIVATYGGGNHSATLWVSISATETQAIELNQLMTERIAAGNSPFVPVGPMEIQGQVVQLLTDDAGGHAYFQSGRYVVWLMSDSETFISVLHACLEIYGGEAAA